MRPGRLEPAETLIARLRSKLKSLDQQARTSISRKTDSDNRQDSIATRPPEAYRVAAPVPVEHDRIK
jgi:hypothetical protein